MSEKARTTRRRNALLAAGAAAVLLLGGSTYALWSAQGTADGGKIIAGDLRLEVGATQLWDVSPDRSDAESILVEGYTTQELPLKDADGVAVTGHLIDRSDVPEPNYTDDPSWRIVPGDTVLLTIPVEMTLQGDNLVAKLTMGVTGEKLVASNTFLDGFLTNDDIKWSLHDSAGTMLQGPSPLPTEDTTALGYFQAPTAGQDQGSPEADDVPFVNASDISQITGEAILALWITFRDGTDDQQQQDTSPNGDSSTLLELSDAIPLSLTQVRCGVGNFLPSC